MCRPNIIIYLDINGDFFSKNLNALQRCGKWDTMDYLEMLYQEYEVFIESIGKTIPVIRVPWEEFRSG